MDTLDTWAAVLGWCTLINFAILLLGSLAVMTRRKQIGAIHGSMFGMEPRDLRPEYFRYLANYKLLVIVFNLVPYIAIRIVAG